MSQVCTGGAYINSQGIVHHNLTPSNILLTRGGTVKITGFSLAKYIHKTTKMVSDINSTSHSILTAHQVIDGTPRYLAPEVLSQKYHKDLVNRVDSWSVGVITYETYV